VILVCLMLPSSSLLDCMISATVARDLLQSCDRYIDTRAEGGMTALHLAALSGTLACVQLLLEAGASMMVTTRSV
jgi:ankyrin repeat protein